MTGLGYVSRMQEYAVKRHAQLQRHQVWMLAAINLHTGREYTLAEVQRVTERALEMMRTSWTDDLDAAWSRAKREYDAGLLEVQP